MANICMSFVSMETVNVAAKRLAVSFFAVNHGRLGRSLSGRRIPVSGNRIFCRHGIPEHVVQNARGMKPDPDAGGFIGPGIRFMQENGDPAALFLPRLCLSAEPPARMKENPAARFIVHNNS